MPHDAFLNKSTPELFFSVGEPSGDLHGANLIQALRSRIPGLSVRGFGGERMADSNCYLDYELTKLAVVGFAEVVPKLREFFRVADIASDIFDSERPDAVVLIDFPGFNWHIARRAKERGIPVCYYLPPQMWAWGGWRISKIRKYVDHVLCNLPFEKAWYAERGVEAEYVGHPFFDEVSHRELDQQFLLEHGAKGECTVAVLPGSRGREVKNIWPMQLEILRELSSRYPNVRFHLACLREEHLELCRSMLTSQDRGMHLKMHVGKTSELIELADCTLMKSGSVSLEMMARGTPSVVLYHVSRLTYAIGRALTNLESMTLPNMIAKETIMPEFLAVGSRKTDTIERTIAAMDRLISDRDERKRQKQALLDLNLQFGRTGASERAASVLVTKLGLDKAGEAMIFNSESQPSVSRKAA